MPKNSPLFILLAAVFSLCLYADDFWPLPGPLTVKFLDIGQGDSTFIITPHGRTVLVDGGPGNTLLERLGEESSFWHKSFDLVVLTHPDLDHLEGLIELLRRYEVRRLLMNGALHPSAAYETFLREVKEFGTPVSFSDPKQDWELDNEVFLDILAPLESVAMKEVEHSNNAATVGILRYGATSLLLTADIEAVTEEALLASDTDLRADVLKSPHHGSRTSSTLPFLQAVKAKEAFIMVGRENPFDHPHLDTVLHYDDLKMAWRSTKEEGTMTIRSDGVQWGQ